MDAFNTIKNLNDNEIDNYIKQRLSKLSKLEVKEIGYNTGTTIYSGILDKNVKINTYYELLENNDYVSIIFGNVVLDDSNMYKYLIKEVKKCDNPLEAVINASNNYLFLNSKEREIMNVDQIREKFYDIFSASKNKSLSVNVFHKHKMAMCTEIAGVVHNMFLFLGIKSDYVIGNLNGEDHAFNIVHYFGKGNDSILLDNCKEVNSKAGIIILDPEMLEQLYSFKKVSFTDRDIKNTYKKLFCLDVTSAPQKMEYSIMEDAYFEITGYEEIKSNNNKKLLFRRIEKED